jgi:hypothetical protein
MSHVLLRAAAKAHLPMHAAAHALSLFVDRGAHDLRSDRSIIIAVRMKLLRCRRPADA